MITLLDVPLSPYAQKVKLALLEKGLEFQTEIPDLDAPSDALRAQSPRVEVPALIDSTDGVSVFDSSVILEYLEDRWPTPPLLPPSARERARVRLIEEICDTAYDAVNWGVAEVLVFKRAEGELATQLLARAATQVQGLNARLERELTDRAFLNGDQFGFGDIAAYPFVNGAAALGNKPAPGSKLEAWLRATRKRPSAERVKVDIMATIQEFLKRPSQIAEGTHKRQYRDHRLDWMLRSGGLEVVLAGMKANNLRFSYDFE